MHGRLRARPGAVVARRRAGRLQRPAAGPRLAALRGDHGGRHPARPGDRRRRHQPDDQRPRGVHAGQRVHPRRERGPGLLRGRRLLRPRHRRRRRHRPPGGAPGSSRASPSSTSGRWTSGGSGRSTAPRPTRWPGRSRTTRPTTTSTIRTRSAWPAGRCAPSPTYGRLAALGASFGEKSGWERPNWFEANAAAGDEALRPRGWAGKHWTPAIGAEALATRRAAGPVRRDELRQDRGRRAGRRRLPPGPVRQRRRPAGRQRRLHPDAQPARRHRVRLHGHPARRGPVPHRDRHGVRQPRSRLDPRPRSGGRVRLGPRRDLRRGRASGCGARGRATSSLRSRRTTSRTRPSRT